MGDQHTVFVRNDARADYREVSRHADREEAYAAMRAALGKHQPGATARVDPGGETFLLRPDRTIIEVMSD